MTTTVETALGPVATAGLGPTLMHEHIVTRSPGVQENWPHLWDRDAILAIAERKMADLYRRGIRAIVDLTTVDLGRDIGLIVDVARRSRARVIVATGVWWMPQRHLSAHGVDAVADLFIRDITRGIGTSGVKVAIVYEIPNIGPRISIYSRQGEMLPRLGQRPAGLEPGQFISPRGLAVDSRGDIYVGEVSFTNWGNRYKGQPHPPGLRSLQKLAKVR